MRKIVIFIVLLVTALRVFATEYEALSVKAGRFYAYREWASALAMYQLMLDQRPDVADTYCHAIVASSMEGMTDESVRLLSQSMNAHVPLDSIYDGVQRLAFELGNALLYENFLESVGERYPWMRRNIDGRMLDYYVWRRDGRGMVEYAGRMLEGMPDNIRFLTVLADGYFALGRNRDAVDTYSKIIALDPDNYHALLVLGNYYDNVGRQDRFNEEARLLAVMYLTRADALKSTPYVTSRISSTSR